MNFQAKIVFTSVVILVIALTLNSLLSLATFEKIYVSSMLSTYEVAGFNIKRRIETGIRWKPLENFKGMQKMIDSEMAKTPDLSYMCVLSPSGEILFHSDQSNVGKRLPVKIPNFDGQKLVESELVEGMYLTFIPLYSSSKKLSGFVNISFSREGIYKKLKSMAIESLHFLWIVIILTSLGMIFFLYILIARPIKRELVQTGQMLEWPYEMIDFEKGEEGKDRNFAETLDQYSINMTPFKGLGCQSQLDIDRNKNELYRLKWYIYKIVTNAFFFLRKLEKLKLEHSEFFSAYDKSCTHKIQTNDFLNKLSLDDHEIPNTEFCNIDNEYVSKSKISLRAKTFLIAVIIIVAGQLFYSKINVDSFHSSYHESLQNKCKKLGSLLKTDVEYLLNLNIPITKLIKLEETLKKILDTTPELEFIEINDLSGYVLYYADHNTIGRVEPGTIPSKKFIDKTFSWMPGGKDVSANMTDTILPLYYQKKNAHLGYIKMRLSTKLVISKSRALLLDMITVIMTSLLITFEFLSFFISYNISDPLHQFVDDIRKSLNRLSLLRQKKMFIRELGSMTSQCNNFFIHFSTLIKPYISFKDNSPEIQKDLKAQMGNDKQGKLIDLQRQMDDLVSDLAPGKFLHEDYTESAGKEVETSHTSYSYIRPVIFLFLISSGLCASFFPMYTNMLYQPIGNLSKEIVLALPISVFMIFFAISMPITGSWTDYLGWQKPLLIGILVSGIAHLLTAIAQDIYQLFLFRSLTGIGYGMVVMAAQRYVIDNTTNKTRTLGMSSFLSAFFSGNLVGTVIGGMLADKIGYRNIFVISGILALFAFTYSIVLFGEMSAKTINPKEVKEVIPFKKIFLTLRDREFFAITIFQAIPSKLVFIGFLFYFVPLYLKQLGVLQSDIGRTIMCYGLSMVFLGPLVSRFLNNAAHRKYYILTGGLIIGFSMLSFKIYSGFLPLIVIVTMLGLGHSISVSSQAAAIMETTIVKKMGTGIGMGAFRFWERVGNVLGPIFMGFLIAKTDYTLAVFFLGSFLLLFSFFYFIMIFLNKK